ncbi:NAD(P)-dependent oxidoreductase [Escherichia coli]|uniref:NAD(P)-dependent oxidoreductase n=1 Tax=Escherichia coli TaxID=562 RepID=UPI0031345464
MDLDAAAKAGITVAEITGSNSISVAEHVVMMVLSLVRNYLPSHQISADGGWNIADCVTRSYDVEGMHFGTIGAGRIGLAVLRRLKAFDMPLHYTQRHRLASAIEEELGLTYHPDAESLARTVDIVNLQVPLYPSTEHFFNQKMISEMSKRAARTVLTGMCYSFGNATRQGSSSLTRFIGQSAITSSTWRR